MEFIPLPEMAGKEGEAVPELDSLPLIALRARSRGESGAGDWGGLVVIFSIGSFRLSEDEDSVWVIGCIIIAGDAMVSVEELVPSSRPPVMASSAECCFFGALDGSVSEDSGSDADGCSVAPDVVKSACCLTYPLARTVKLSFGCVAIVALGPLGGVEPAISSGIASQLTPFP